MKEKFLAIKEIERLMSGAIDQNQMERLHSVLTHCLLNKGDFVCGNGKFANNEEIIGAFLNAKTLEGCSGRTVRFYSSTLTSFVNKIDKSLLGIKTDDIRLYLSECQRSGTMGNITVDNIRRVISSLFSWLEAEDIIYKSPVRRINKIKARQSVKPTISDEAMERLRDKCCPRDLAIVDLLSSTGMRVGELVRLKREDIDFEKKECVVHGKGNKERRVYFDARAKIHLDSYLASRDDENTALFVSLKAPYNRLEISGVESRLRKLGVDCLGQRIHPHKFRRTLATKAIDKGMPIEQVQVLLGHSKIDTTLHYAMVDQENVRQSHRRYIG